MAFFISEDLLIAKVGNFFFTFAHLYFTLNKLVNKKYKLELNNNDFGVVSMFLLKYYQDSYAPVSHIHIGLAKDDSIKGNGELTILASASAEPISGKEAKRILGID
ncbi:hypothetical protein ABCY62_03890 [Acetivibrio clariflavus]|uniref:hypothetical protein n=1 Tax=Acetivibrio clariflavus TaxID=288965 RepID=UPI0031F55DB8